MFIFFIRRLLSWILHASREIDKKNRKIKKMIKAAVTYESILNLKIGMNINVHLYLNYD